MKTMNHKQKKHLASSLMRQEDWVNHVPVFQSRGWQERKEMIAKKVEKRLVNSQNKHSSEPEGTEKV